LAGAVAAARGDPICPAAADVATGNGAELVGCEVQARSVLVTVRVVGPHWLGQEADLEARARAGAVA
jgi:hypothetical protein